MTKPKPWWKKPVEATLKFIHADRTSAAAEEIRDRIKDIATLLDDPALSLRLRELFADGIKDAKEHLAKIQESLTEIDQQCEGADDDEDIEAALAENDNLFELVEHSHRYVDSHDRGLACEAWDYVSFKQALENL